MVEEYLAETVLAAEKYPVRFEKACRALIGAAEGGVPVYSTSTTWDLGRDGKGYHPSGDVIAVCCSLEPEIDEKATRDIKRLRESRLKVTRLYFCSKERVSEQKQEQIEAALARLVPNTTHIRVLGRQQLADLAQQYPDQFREEYGHDYEALLTLLRRGEAEPRADSEALHLALSTVAHESSNEIRTELYEGSLRLILSDGRPRSPVQCARDVSQSFRLAQMLSAEALLPHLQRLEERGEIQKVDGGYLLTAMGRLEVEAQDENAKRKLLEGRHVIRREMENGIGYALATEHFNRIWNIVQERLTAFFFSRGNQMIAFVSHLLGAEAEEPRVEPAGFVQELAAAVGATSSSGDQAKELESAVRSMFEEPLSLANEWLVQLCASFVALCSLGLESTSGKAVARLLSRTNLVLDTDVVLSLLCIGEPNHESVLAVVKRWNALGGTVYVSKEVLHESNYHAQIANYDFEQVQRWLPGTPRDRLRLIENAFVRAFAEHVARGQARPGNWAGFIEQYQSPTSRTNGQISRILAEEFHVKTLEARDGKDGLKARAATYLHQQVEKRAGSRGQAQLKKAKDKADRDAALYSDIVASIRRERQQPEGHSFLLVSSSQRLVELEQKFAEVGEPYFVVTVGMLLYLISLVPDVSFGLGSLRALLFDGPRAGFSNDLERTLLRVIKESGAYDVPWARRSNLMRKFHERLLDRAKEAAEGREVDVSQLEERIGRGEEKEMAVQVLKEALDAAPANRLLEEENTRLREQLEKLKKELAESRADRGKATKR